MTRLWTRKVNAGRAMSICVVLVFVSAMPLISRVIVGVALLMFVETLNKVMDKRSVTKEHHD